MFFRKSGKDTKDQQADNGGEQPGFFQRMFSGLSRTRQSLVTRVRKAIRLRARLDEGLLEDIEEILIQADVGMETTEKIIDALRLESSSGDPSEVVLDRLKKAIRDILQRNGRPFAVDPEKKPYVVLVVGVNGVGKTTTIGKMARQLAGEGKKVMIVAGDTFRAAAIEQLTIWAERSGARIVKSEMGADAAAVCYRAIEEARADGSDVVLIDTAGRLHNKKHLMDELDKIVRVIRKTLPDGPHETLLALDATTGQNALTQARIFAEKTGVTGLVMTKLDGTAKGGVLIALCDQLEQPVMMIGVGEGEDDLRPFEPDAFVEALFMEDATEAAETPTG